ncbi:hypothetical protein [Dactylosporangium salmoneum]|uniref:Uncharacterized protein n=1 Tax=Dactylosporangium salmoneum TaxID=53361 RepID=A0ABN3FZE3_9ACTN
MLRRPLARWLKVAPAEIDDDLRQPPATWDDLVISHVLRLMVWGVAAGGCFVLGIASATVEQLVSGHSGQPSAALQVLFGTALVTALLHGAAFVLVDLSSARRAGRRGAGVSRRNMAPGGPVGLVRVLLRPGNRYFLVAAAFFAVAVVSVSG